MKKISHFLVFLSLIACQIEDKDAPTPDDSYVKYYGEASTTYEMVDMEVIYDVSDSSVVNSIIMLGTRTLFDGGGSDIYLLKTDATGAFIADTAYSYDSNSIDVATQLSKAGEDILVVGNTTTSADVPLKGVVWNVFKTDLTPVSQPDTGTTLYSIFTNPASPTQISANDLIQISDGNFIMVGNYETQANEQKYYRLKIDATQIGNISYPSNDTNSDPALMWFEKGGAGAANNDLVRAFEEPSGDLFFAGNSSFIDNDGNGGVNVILIRATSSGSTIDPQSFGFNLNGSTPNASDIMTDAIQKQGGYAIVGTSSANNLEQGFYIDSGTPSQRILLSSSYTLNDVSTETMAIGITQGSKNDFVIVGQYPDFRVDNNNNPENKRAEAMIYRTDQFGVAIDGYEVNYGLNAGEDKAVVAKTLPDGKILVGATIDFGSGSTLMSLIKLNDTGQLDN